MTRTALLCEMFAVFVGFIALSGAFVVDLQLRIQVLEGKSSVEGFIEVDIGRWGGVVWRGCVNGGHSEILGALGAILDMERLIYTSASSPCLLTIVSVQFHRSMRLWVD